MKILFPTFVLLLALALAGCKPTEQNYRAAYDVAQQKKKAESEDPDLLPGGGKLVKFDAPKARVVGSDTLRIKTVRLKGLDGATPGKWNVAVAFFKMPTNCKALASRLVSEGYRAFVAETPGPGYYVVAGAFPDLQDAAAVYSEFREKHPADYFVGLDGEPLLLER